MQKGSRRRRGDEEDNNRRKRKRSSWEEEQVLVGEHDVVMEMTWKMAPGATAVCTGPTIAHAEAEARMGSHIKDSCRNGEDAAMGDQGGCTQVHWMPQKVDRRLQQMIQRLDLGLRWFQGVGVAVVPTSWGRGIKVRRGLQCRGRSCPR
ncbi:unnamed protein product [Arabis nemorensis]|uniref:Uncharacterized protein n=1 Tax=Arabis nemorensis TaxID=586526 RepID=A0A565CQ40_9BRAS|nr:unnamed protein product [Arabis nemorensis]